MDKFTWTYMETVMSADILVNGCDEIDTHRRAVGLNVALHIQAFVPGQSRVDAE